MGTEVLGMYTELSKYQELDRKELNRYIDEDLWEFVGRDPEEVIEVYRRMKARAGKMNMLQIILHKGSR